VIRIDGVSRSEEIDTHGRGNLAASVDARGLTVHGWAFGDERIATDVEILCGDDLLVRMPIALERPDVVAEVGDRPGAAHSGFMATLQPRRDGAGVLRVQVAFEEGEAVPLGAVVVTAAGVESPSEDGTAWTYSQSPAALDKVLVGRDGWLFLRGDSNDAIGQQTGRVRYTERDKERLGEVLAEREQLAEEAGAVWLTAVVPDKEIVYSEQLPSEIVPRARRPVHDFLEIAAGVGADAVYLLDEMVAAKYEGDLYMRRDTHWNYRGAFVAYRAICRELNCLGVEVDAVAGEEVEWWERTKEGDLSGKLPGSPPCVETRATLRRSWSRRTYDNSVRNHGRAMIHERDDSSGPSCLVFGESFAETLLYFLQESFGRVVFVHTSMFVRELVERERPDAILSLPIERFLIRVPDDTDALAKLEATAQGKGGELPWSAEVG